MPRRKPFNAKIVQSNLCESDLPVARAGAQSGWMGSFAKGIQVQGYYTLTTI